MKDHNTIPALPTIPDEEALIPDAKVRQLLGGCSHMFIVRREKDDPTFPPAIRIRNRKFRRYGEVQRWLRSLARR